MRWNGSGGSHLKKSAATKAKKLLFPSPSTAAAAADCHN
jgi:hypothetical protein